MLTCLKCGVASGISSEVEVSRAVTKGATGKAGNRAAKTLRITQSEDNRLNEYGGYWAYGCRNLGINQTFWLGRAPTYLPTCKSLVSFCLGFRRTSNQRQHTRRWSDKKKTKKGGGAGYRSLCLVHAKHALYHLSYTPSIHSQPWRRPTRLKSTRPRQFPPSESGAGPLG
jgi:hypothetical protein